MECKSKSISKYNEEPTGFFYVLMQFIFAIFVSLILIGILSIVTLLGSDIAAVMGIIFLIPIIVAHNCGENLIREYFRKRSPQKQIDQF